MKMRVKKNDIVQVIAGKERGKKGRVLRSFPADSRIIVEKLNMLKRHTKPSDQNRQGGIIEKEGTIHISNVMAVCAKCDKATRISRKILDDGKKVRVCKKCDEVLD